MRESNIVKKLIREIKRPFQRLFLASNTVSHGRRFDFDSDGMATCNNCDFLTDPQFVRAHEAGKATTPEWNNADFRWRQRIVLWAAEYASQLDGDFVECGVNRGYLSRMIFEYIPFTTLGKSFYLLDTYEGFVAEQLSEQEWKNQGSHLPSAYSSSYDDVCKTFSPFGDCVKIIKGKVPDTLPQVTADKVAYLSIDMNCAAPEIAAAEYFWTKLVPGGVIVLDDYGFKIFVESKKAFNEFAKRKNTTILPLPTGQGIIIKQ